MAFSFYKRALGMGITKGALKFFIFKNFCVSVEQTKFCIQFCNFMENYFNFSGRRNVPVIACCLYIAARLKSIHLLLLDFSDAVQV
jgi:hypothetical protein